jgi:DNA transposition AAA+ family ATPase
VIAGTLEIRIELFDQLDDHDWPGNVRKATWMENVLRGSERTIIVDNAHKLHFSGLEWLFDLHDATLCPMALIGNPEVLHVLRRSDQLFSRVGIVRHLKPAASKEDNDDEIVAGKLIEQICPEARKELIEDASNVVARMGHARSLRKQLVLARELRDGKRMPWASAARAADSSARVGAFMVWSPRR